MSIRFSVIGLTHNHVYSLTDLLLGAGAELVAVHSDEPANLAQYRERFPQAAVAGSPDDILNDDSIQLVIGIPLPAERAPLGIRVLQGGKDYLADKPGFVSLEQLHEARRVQAETGRKFIVYFSERFANPASVKAEELVKAGAIGRVLHMTGMGPHLMNPQQRPEWFFHRANTGGILNDLACHQIDQFFTYTGSTDAQISSAHLANFHHPQYPNIEDYGDITLRSGSATAFIRVDWFTPQGLGAWGDVRLFLVGTEGYIEVRKIIDVQGRSGGNHLFLVNQQGQQYIDCNSVAMPFGEQVVQDVLHRTETAIGQQHIFRVSELALQAEQQAVRVG